MKSKSENTTAFIIEKTAPIFNKHGYVGTSLSDITLATGLTKGAIYGNFESKEHLAVEAFNYNVRKVIGYIADRVNSEETASAKLRAITDFYRSYYQLTMSFGGCPVLNVGIDSNHQNTALKERVNEVIRKLIQRIDDILRMGIVQKEFKSITNTKQYATKVYSIIEGSVFTAIMMKDEHHLVEMMDFLDDMFESDLEN